MFKHHSLIALLLALGMPLIVLAGSPSENIAPTVEVEEEVYTFESADNGSGPMWCYGNTSIVRSGNQVFASGLETIPGEHPIVPVMIRDTDRTSALVKHLFDHDILVTGLNFPVVPRGDEEIRLQVSAVHTEQDIEYLLQVLHG